MLLQDYLTMAKYLDSLAFHRFRAVVGGLRWPTVVQKISRAEIATNNINTPFTLFILGAADLRQPIGFLWPQLPPQSRHRARFGRAMPSPIELTGPTAETIMHVDTQPSPTEDTALDSTDTAVAAPHRLTTRAIGIAAVAAAVRFQDRPRGVAPSAGMRVASR